MTLSGRAALVLLGLVIVLWGLNWPVMKVGLEYIPPLLFTSIRMVLGCLCMVFAAAVMGQLRRPYRDEWTLVLSVGLIQMALFLGLVTIALQYVPAGRSSILAYTTSLWVLPIAAMTLGETLTRPRLAGFALGIGGVAVMFNPFGFDWTNPAVVIGNGLLLLAALCWALLIVYVRAQRNQGPPLTLAPWQFGIAAIVLLPIALLVEDASTVTWSDPVLLGVLFYNGPLATAFPFWAIITITRALPAVTTSIGSLGVPAFGVAASAVLLGEALTGTNIVGLLLIGAGVATVTLSDRNRRNEPDSDSTVSTENRTF
ncbi:DMT family transporter [Aquisalimonas asiatica]|uniref:Threonine/homoserine efflux transporter RhtA n=1 Tax=Aquisalimonas asiatica TaxID=406100 RepID=A0A1H8VL06_9GAMM|nr:DMT family transporter [Aquisalimonas asiatica]SEP15887.1 Threonine/homoserine efflux transporter RhtA [Aquisalimonas asiatica]